MRQLLAISVLFVCASIAPGQTFPGTVPGKAIGDGLPASFQASGVTWHPRLGRLFLAGDEGTLAAMEANGSLVETWSIGGDLEALALADANSDFLYIGIESPDSIIEWNVVTHQVTRTFDLTPWMQSISANQGLEGLTFLPDDSAPEGGMFLAGLQADGKVYRFRLPIASSSTDTSVEFLGSFAPIPGRIDLRSIEYDAASDVIYLAWVEFNRISKLDRAGALLSEWQLPGTKPEGLAIRGCELYVADDNGAPTVIRYGSFPSVAACRSIESDAHHVSLAAGGMVQFSLHAAPPLLPGDVYLLLGSASGTAPGIAAGLASLPLVPDSYLVLTATLANTGPFEGTLGSFDVTGSAVSRIVVPQSTVPSLIGLTLHHAWLGAASGSTFALVASDPVSLTFVP